MGSWGEDQGPEVPALSLKMTFSEDSHGVLTAATIFGVTGPARLDQAWRI